MVWYLFYTPPPAKHSTDNSIYQFSVKDIDGNVVSLDKYHDKVLLISNVASEWQYTKTHYAQFVELYNKYKDDGLVVLVFPCNQFGEQEPGTDAQIKEKLTTDFNVNFPIFSKIDVIGKDAHPLFEYLQEQTAGGDIKWNFEKFLVNRQGFPVERFRSGTTPNELEKDIQQLLGA